MASRASTFFLTTILIHSGLLVGPQCFAQAETKSPAAKQGGHPDRPNSSKQMQKMYDTLSELMVDVTSDERFFSKTRTASILSNAKKLAGTAHQVSEDFSKSRADVTGDLISGLFQSEIQRAANELERGNRNYARTILRAVPGYCIACHTRSNYGPSFSSLPNKMGADALSPLARAEFLAATRQYDLAIEHFDKITADPSFFSGRPFDWERAIRYGIAIAVRVKASPELTSKFVDRVMQSQQSAGFFKEYAAAWKKSISSWKDEIARTPTTEDGMAGEIKRLMSQALSMQRFPMDRNGDIYFLRATALADDLLRKHPLGKSAPEALFAMGVSYQALRDLYLWNLHELYFEACIRKGDKQEIARSCFHRYEESIHTGYSGSAGTSIPKDVSLKLQELSKVAGVSSETEVK